MADSSGGQSETACRSSTDILPFYGKYGGADISVCPSTHGQTEMSAPPLHIGCQWKLDGTGSFAASALHARRQTQHWRAKPPVPPDFERLRRRTLPPVGRDFEDQIESRIEIAQWSFEQRAGLVDFHRRVARPGTRPASSAAVRGRTPSGEKPSRSASRRVRETRFNFSVPARWMVPQKFPAASSSTPGPA